MMNELKKVRILYCQICIDVPSAIQKTPQKISIKK